MIPNIKEHFVDQQPEEHGILILFTHCMSGILPRSFLSEQRYEQPGVFVIDDERNVHDPQSLVKQDPLDIDCVLDEEVGLTVAP
jgi:hypothetical protein